MVQCEAGTLIAQRYRLTQHISGGGMGAVFKGEDTQLFGRPVAIKFLHQNLLGEDPLHQQLRKRFQEEARVSTLLGEHPRIINIFDYGIEANQQPYLVMEYLSGQSFAELMTGAEPLLPRRVVQLGRQICSGLHHAHTFTLNTLEGPEIRGVIHRDIKPSNLFVIGDANIEESVKILDFGIAKVNSDLSQALGTQTSGFLGTARYASPEQIRGEILDHRSDIYSLGIVLYRMLSGGQMPFSPPTDSFSAWYQTHNFQPPLSFGEVYAPYPIPPLLEEVILACLSKDPVDRPGSMQELGQALETVLENLPPLSLGGSGPIQVPIVHGSSLTVGTHAWTPPTLEAPENTFTSAGSIQAATQSSRRQPPQSARQARAKQAPVATAAPRPSRQPSDPHDSHPSQRDQTLVLNSSAPGMAASRLWILISLAVAGIVMGGVGYWGRPSPPEEVDLDPDITLDPEPVMGLPTDPLLLPEPRFVEPNRLASPEEALAGSQPPTPTPEPPPAPVNAPPPPAPVAIPAAPPPPVFTPLIPPVATPTPPLVPVTPPQPRQPPPGSTLQRIRERIRDR